MNTRLAGAAIVLLIGLGACSDGNQSKSGNGSQATTSSTVAGRSGVNAPADQTDISATTTSSGPARAGATGTDGQPTSGVTGPRSDPTTTSTEPYAQR